MASKESKPLIVADATKGIKVNAAVVAKTFRDEVKLKVEAMKKAGLGTLRCNVLDQEPKTWMPDRQTN
jgi:hypothetical protein